LQPFSVGARNCIGKNLANAEIRLLLASLLWHFDLSLSEETDSDWRAQKAWFVWQRKPLLVRVVERVDIQKVEGGEKAEEGFGKVGGMESEKAGDGESGLGAE